MTHPELIFVSIAGKDVSIKELQADVDAASKKGYNREFAFTIHTVQALVDKIMELDNALNASINVNTEALYQLRCVSGSRNSFTPETHEFLHKFMRQGDETISYRSKEVERMHQQANDFLKQYDKS